MRITDTLIIGNLNSAASLDVCIDSDCTGAQVHDNIVAGDTGLAYAGKHVNAGDA